MKGKTKPFFYSDMIATICLLPDDKGKIIARGIAIRSRQDPQDGKVGRDIAYHRALEAAGRKRYCQPIKISAKRSNWYDTINMSLVIDRFGDWKGYYKPKLTATEKLILTMRHGPGNYQIEIEGE